MSSEPEANPSRTVVITGASSGIGAALALALAECGHRVAIGARRADRLKEVETAIQDEGGTVLAHSLDVTDVTSIEEFLAATRNAFGPIDVAINNAGLSIPGWVHESDPGDLRREIETNLLGPMLVSRSVVGEMRERASGDLVFIGSDNADQPRPQQAGYSASKAGLKNFCRVLAMELEGSGVRVTHIRLGPTQSEFGFGWAPETMTSVIRSWEPFGLTRHLMAFMESAEVARAVIHAIDTQRSATYANIELQPTPPVKRG